MPGFKSILKKQPISGLAISAGAAAVALFDHARDRSGERTCNSAMPTNAVSTTFVLVTQKCFSARNRDKFKFYA
jgi:hypothetical protein